MLNTIYPVEKNSSATKMMNFLLKKGKRAKAQKLFFETLTTIAKTLKHQSDLIKAFHFHSFNEQRKANDKFVYFLGMQTLKKGKKKNLDIHNQQPKANDKLTESLEANLDILEKGIENVAPYLEVRKVRVSGKTRLVPSIIRPSKQQSIALHWLIEGAKKRKKKTFPLSEFLASELIDAFNKQGNARQKRNESHKIAYSNRSFLRYRWW